MKGARILLLRLIFDAFDKHMLGASFCLMRWILRCPAISELLEDYWIWGHRSTSNFKSDVDECTDRDELNSISNLLTGWAHWLLKVPAHKIFAELVYWLSSERKKIEPLVTQLCTFMTFFFESAELDENSVKSSKWATPRLRLTLHRFLSCFRR